MQIFEAFRALNALNEDIFSLDAEGVEKLSDFTKSDDLEDEVQVIDPDAETEDDLQDNYIGKVILDCCVCHSKLYKDKSEVEVDETGELANIGEECPYCFTPDGFKVIGEVVAFGEEPEEVEEPESEDEIEEVDEGLTEGLHEAIPAAFGGTVRGGGGSTQARNKFDNLEGKKTKKVLAKNLKVNDETNTGKIHTVTNCGNRMKIRYYGGYEDNVAFDYEYDVLDEAFSLTEAEEGANDLQKVLNEHIKEIAEIVKFFIPEFMGSQKKELEMKLNNLNSKNSTVGGPLIRIYNMIKNSSEDTNAQPEKNQEPQEPQKTQEPQEAPEANESLKEGIEDLSMTANGTHVDVSEEDGGKVTVTMEPVTADGGEMIAPVSPESEAEIMSDEEDEAPAEESGLDMPAEEESEIDADFDEFDEESMDGLGESYFKRVYENVNSFKTTAVKTSGNSMIIEGLLEFESGNKKNTSFVFEALDATKTGKFRFVGDNKELTEGKKAFMLTGTINNKKLMVESLNYNYKHIDAQGKSSRVYGTERLTKGV